VWLFRSQQAHLALPPAAAARLLDLMTRSRDYLLEAIQQAVAQGVMRSDLTPQSILMLVMGVIQASSGSAALRPHQAAQQKNQELEPLHALRYLLLTIPTPTGADKGGPC